MNILVLCLSDGKGGLEHYIAKLAHYVKQTGHSLTLCTKRGTDLDKLLAGEPGEKLYLERISTYFPVLCARKLARFIDQHKVDHLFINWGADLPLAAMAKAMSKQQPKLIYSRHMKIPKDKRDIYHNWVYSKVDLLLTITEQVRAEALRHLPLRQQQIKNCYLGVAKPPAEPDNCQAVRKSLGMPADGFLVALFGRIEKAKGQHILIEATRILKQRNVLLHTAIIGHVMDDDYYTNLVETIKNNDLSEQITLLDFIPAPMAIMPCFDVITLTTIEETFGLVLVEAMRCGVAVIGSRAGGVKEIIDEGICGLMFESGNPEALADALQDLYTDVAKREKFAIEGKAKADRMFDQDTHFKQLMQLLSQA